MFYTKTSPNLNVSTRMSWSISSILKPICAFSSARMKPEWINKRKLHAIINHNQPWLNSNRILNYTPRKNQKPQGRMRNMKSIQGKKAKRHSSLILLKSCFLSVWFLSRLRFWNGEYCIGILHLPRLLNALSL